MKRFILGFLLSMLVAGCYLGPFVYRAPSGRMLASTGGSVGTKSKKDAATVVLPDGTKMSRSSEDRDETAIPRNYLQADVAKTLADISGSVSKNAANNVTAREASRNAVETTRIRETAATERMSLEVPQ